MRFVPDPPTAVKTSEDIEQWECGREQRIALVEPTTTTAQLHDLHVGKLDDRLEPLTPGVKF